ncbi:LolA family protein [Magnetospirillum molischianum]|uniref:Outer membrane lipoprotein-sorting protein n=1 Tax=Magnetospirillum molischianum DSM 120 TaxID=1150626 RepID=H8FV69_MAGML|nr:hypothetical protein [Magnetospirillum molischianum]CCG42257.1 conserved exported hypothetical protein [Magnetospirillum molischianum DSM 120]
MPRLLGALILICALVGGSDARAAEQALDVLDAQVSYSADFTMTGPRGAYTGRVWHAPGSERREVATQGGGQGVLIHRDTGTAYFLGIGGKWYVSLSMEAASTLIGGLQSWEITRTRIGEENVAGVRATRWNAQATGPKGGFEGEIWTSRDGIVLKAVGTVAAPGGNRSPVEMTLSRLKVGTVDPQMLEVPEGWFSLDLRKLPADRVVQAIEGMKPMLDKRGSH